MSCCCVLSNVLIISYLCEGGSLFRGIAFAQIAEDEMVAGNAIFVGACSGLIYYLCPVKKSM